MAGEVISPPVHVLDFGYRSPDPIDYSRNAFLLGSSVNDAVQHSMEAKNAFLLQQVNAQKQMELAQQQHAAALQLQTMRDQMYLDRADKMQHWHAQVQQMRDDAYRLKDTTDQFRAYGMPLPARPAGMSDADYNNLLQEPLGKVIEQRQGELKGKYINGLKNRDAINKQADDLTTDARKQAMPIVAGDWSSGGQKFNTWLTSQPQEAQDIYNAARAKKQSQGDALKAAGLLDAQKAAVAGDLSTRTAELLRGPDFVERMKMIQGRYNLNEHQMSEAGVGYFNGKRVALPYADKALNDAITEHGNALYNNPVTTPTAPAINAPPAGAPQPKANNPIFPMQEPPLNTAPLAYVGRFLRDATQPATQGSSLLEDGKNFTEADRQAVAANPGFWNAFFSPWQNIRSLWDSNAIYGEAPPVDARFAPLPMPPASANPILASRAFVNQLVGANPNVAIPSVIPPALPPPTNAPVQAVPPQPLLPVAPSGINLFSPPAAAPTPTPDLGASALPFIPGTDSYYMANAAGIK